MADALSGREARVDFFASVNLLVSGLTLVIQLFLTGRLLPIFGVAMGLSIVPIVTSFGFLLLAYQPSLMALALVEVFRKTSNYGITRPSREILYTGVSRREKYLSKSFIDTFVYRAGDAVASGAFLKIASLTTNLQVISLLAIPISILYLFVGILLGREHSKKSQSLK